MSTNCAGSTTARISVTVTDFQEIGGKRYCSHADIELTDTGNGRVSQGRINDPIMVYAEVCLDFCIHARKGDKCSYMPIGIGFKEVAGPGAKKAADRSAKEVADRDCKKGDSRDPLGRAAFPLRTVVAKGDTTQLTIFDANPEAGEFEFSLIIQRSDGLLSVVDPQIRNNPVMK